VKKIILSALILFVFSSVASASGIDELTLDKSEAITVEAQNGLRITALESESEKFDNQTDFVEVIKGMKKYSRLRFQKKSNGYALSVDDGTKHSTCNLVKDTNDDFIKIDDCYVGNLSVALNSTSNADTRTGTWETANPPNYYTTEIGATFKATAKGSIIKLRHREDNRGGIWEFVVDGDTDNKVTISTWAATDTVGSIESTIFTGLKNTDHTVVGTFKGDDPDHEPSGSTSRGWVNYATKGELIGAVAGFVNDGLAKTKGLIGTSSNKEMAFNIKNGEVSNWLPEHDAIGTAFNIEEPKFLFDGVEKDISKMATNQFVTSKKFELIQHFYARINKQNVAEVRMTHFIDKSGVLSYSGSITALINITMNTMYPLMIPLDQTTLTEVLTGIGNSKVSSGNESDYFFSYEKDKLLSGAFLSSTNTDYVAAASVKYPLSTMRIGKKIGKPIPTQTMRFWQRTTSPKFYWTSAVNLPLAKGSNYAWGGKIIVAEIDNIYHYLKSNT
jgi:hypothetical protein